jgi:cobalamin biosynthesis protein CbiG
MRLVGVALIALSLASGAAATTSSGLRGVVMRGPTRPVCMAGVPCSAPAKKAKIVFTRNGVSRVAVTDSVGRYRVLLAPGRYTVKFGSIAARFGSKPLTAVVLAGRITVRNFTIDTGIR